MTPVLTKIQRFYHCALWENSDIWNISAQSFKKFAKFTGNILDTIRMLQADIKQNQPNRFGNISLKACYMPYMVMVKVSINFISILHFIV